MPLAIFMSVTARPRSAAIAGTIASSEPCAANLLGAVTKGWPVSSAILAAMARPKSGGALSPVPTAVLQGKAEPIRVAVGGAHQLEKIRGEAGGTFQTAIQGCVPPCDRFRRPISTWPMRGCRATKRSRYWLA